jgi:hypothetical protein
MLEGKYGRLALVGVVGFTTPSASFMAENLKRHTTCLGSFGPRFHLVLQRETGEPSTSGGTFGGAKLACLYE